MMLAPTKGNLCKTKTMFVLFWLVSSIDLTSKRGTYGGGLDNSESLEVPFFKVSCSVHLAHLRVRVKAATLRSFFLRRKYFACEETSAASRNEVSFTNKIRIPTHANGL
jgi:hypothetical protein